MITGDARPKLVSLQHLLLIHVLLENYAEITALLPELRRLAALLAEKPIELQIRWAEGLLARQRGDAARAESLLEEARRGLAAIGDTGLAAIAALEALALPEAFRARRLLRRALAQRRLARPLLDSVRFRLFCPAAA